MLSDAEPCNQENKKSLYYYIKERPANPPNPRNNWSIKREYSLGLYPTWQTEKENK